MFHFRIVSINLSCIITASQGQHSVYIQKNFCSPNYVPITVKTAFDSNSSKLNNSINDSITKRFAEIILCILNLAGN